jgi:aspartyl-tRNA(Asn)/glutamyl-tRNA(Gln) amidotransferase subunit A
MHHNRQMADGQCGAPLLSLASDLAEGRVSSVALIGDCLARIGDPAGEGSRTFTRIYAAQCSEEARAFDSLRGGISSPLAGIPISVKDLFDVAGDVTTAGSIALANAPRATSDATVVKRLRAAGAIVMGRTNMTEFAFSALGLNPHRGTPKNPYDASRIPGGSSSGAATAVAYGYCAASIGTDTAGSVRVPAAFCGLVGFKPTQRRIPREGAFPLSASLDSIGPIARTVACCALLDSIMAGDGQRVLPELPLEGLRFAVPAGALAEDLDEVVGRAYELALRRLSAAGARLITCNLRALKMLEAVEQLGGLIAPEAYATHRGLLSLHSRDYDPRVRSRLEAAASAPAANYIEAAQRRRVAIEAFDRETYPFDAVLAPTVAVAPPRFVELERDDEYRRINSVVRGNAAAVNLLDGCALTVPCHEPGSLPVGLMIIGRRGTDTHVLASGMAVEKGLCAPG